MSTLKGLLHKDRVQVLSEHSHQQIYLRPEHFDCSLEALDVSAQEAGWIGVWQTVVDMAGMRDVTPAVIPPNMISCDRRRAFK